EGNPAVPQLQQVLHGQHGSLSIVDLQAEQTLRAQLPPRDHDRHFLGIALQLRVTEATGKHDDAVYAARNELPHAAIFVLFVPVAAHDQRRIAALPQACLDAPQTFAIERAVDRLGYDTYRQGLAESEAPCGRVGSEIKLCDGRLDRLLQAVA